MGDAGETVTWPTSGSEFEQVRDALEVLQSGGGGAELWTRNGALLCTRFQGEVSLEMARAFTAKGDAVIAQHGRVITFHDWTLIKVYEPAVRVHMVDWTRQVDRRNPAAHILLKPGLVAMGVSVAQLVLRNLHVFQRPGEFVQRFAEHAALAPAELDARYPL